jgi:hypothetical protein
MTDIVNGEIVPAMSGWQALVLIAASLSIAAAIRLVRRSIRGVRL